VPRKTLRRPFGNATTSRRLGGFAQIQLGSKTARPLGRRRYWPIFEAALEHGFSIGLHHRWDHDQRPVAGRLAAVLYRRSSDADPFDDEIRRVSLILEGVFDRYPRSEIVMIEGGFWFGYRSSAGGWMRIVEDARRGPTCTETFDYLKTNLCYATQPVEEPEHPDDLRKVLEWDWLGPHAVFQRYPHWDSTDPHPCMAVPDDRGGKTQPAHDNALAVYSFK